MRGTRFATAGSRTCSLMSLPLCPTSADLSASAQTTRHFGSVTRPEVLDQVGHLVRRSVCRLRACHRGGPAGAEVFGKFFDQGGDDGGVELGSGAALELEDRVVGTSWRVVGPVGGHRGVRVGGGHDARVERDLIAGEPVGVAGAVVAFVVVAYR